MKKTSLKILITIVLLLLILITLNTSSNAAASFSASCSSTSVYVGDTITITVNATNAAGMYLVSASNSNVSLTSGNTNEFLDNASTTIKYKATKAGSVTITATASDMTDLDDSKQKITGTKTFNITIKEKTSTSSGSNNNSSSGSSSSSSNSNSTTTKTPTFKSVNQTVYTTTDCNLRASWSTDSAATSVDAGTELTLTGTSTETINGNTWYRVTYNGTTKYIASFLITYTKPEEKEEESSNKNLSSLSIEGVELTPAFDKDTTQYTATVDGDVTELKIDAKAEDSKATVAIEGNEELKEGDNIIKIKVTAEDNTTRTYFITITKGEGTVTDDTLKLSELVIERVNFEGAFDPDIYTYELSLNTYVENLEITATPNQADATVEIIGNSDFQVGENVVTILITSADGTQTATYQIKVNIAEGVVEEKSELGTVSYIIIGVVIAAVIIGIYLFIRYRKIKKGKMTNSEETDINFMSRYTTNEEEKTEKRKTSKKEKSDVTVDDFLNEASEDENSEKSKKPKGRHSK